MDTENVNPQFQQGQQQPLKQPTPHKAKEVVGAECSFHPPKFYWNFSDYAELVKGEFPLPRGVAMAGKGKDEQGIVMFKDPSSDQWTGTVDAGVSGVGLVVNRDSGGGLRVVGRFSDGAACLTNKILNDDVILRVNGLDITGVAAEELPQLAKTWKQLTLDVKRCDSSGFESEQRVVFSSEELDAGRIFRDGTVIHCIPKKGVLPWQGGMKLRRVIISDATLRIYNGHTKHAEVKYELDVSESGLEPVHTEKVPYGFSLVVPHPTKAGKNVVHLLNFRKDEEVKAWALLVTRVQQRKAETEAIIRTAMKRKATHTISDNGVREGAANSRRTLRRLDR